MSLSLSTDGGRTWSASRVMDASPHLAASTCTHAIMQEGLVAAFGLSNYSAEEVERCCEVPMAYWLFSITKITGSFHRAAILKVS